jgi:DNA invertase Pin-like site-specific DNA recombinase
MEGKSERFIAYYRVSTVQQGRSGLGLEAQRSAVQQHLGSVGGVPAAEYTEVETGKRHDRPQLQMALADCRRRRAKLIIAKLDRLSRNLAFIAALMDGETEFVACDNPYATRLTLHILAAVAEHEREMIAARTRAALQAAKARGVRLGIPAATYRPIKFRKGRPMIAGLALLVLGLVLAVIGMAILFWNIGNGWAIAVIPSQGAAKTTLNTAPPVPIPVAPSGPRQFTDKTARELLALYDGRTPFQADPLIAPHKELWLRASVRTFLGDYIPGRQVRFERALRRGESSRFVVPITNLARPALIKPILAALAESPPSGSSKRWG